jgi:endonuclease G
MLPNAAEEEGVVVDQNYAERPGYDPMFMENVEVPLPRISQKMEADTAVVNEAFRKGSDRFELAYYHYSVYMNKRRRTAWFSAANVDGGHRHDIGKRHGDRWFRDPRISRAEQLGQEAFEHGIDRGHLTRREDTAWGPDVASALKANNDTFHFTNVAACGAVQSRQIAGKELNSSSWKSAADKGGWWSSQTGVAGNDPVYRNDNMTPSALPDPP